MRPDNIVNIQGIDPSIIVQLAYLGSDNFTGMKVPGYFSNTAYLTMKTALALKAVQKSLKQKNLSLFIFDAYRPLKAVNYFANEWSQGPDNNDLKNRFYPNVPKEELVPSGYLSKRSSHSRGGTVDLALYDLDKKELLDFGSEFDFFDPKSFTLSNEISSIAQENRKLLVTKMKKQNFKNYSKEWWHFTYNDEEYPNTYFDFDVI